MLLINVSSTTGSALRFADFESYGLPAPPNGADAEVNGDVVLKFEDESEAITYADQLVVLSDGLNDKDTPQYKAIGDLIMSIRNDEFVQSYNE